MLPGMNPAMMKQAMKKMGIRQEDIDAQRVIIECSDKKIIIENPSVQKVNMSGQVSYQISGNESEEEADTMPDISEDDVEMVMNHANVDREAAIEAIADANGDLAEAILQLEKKK